MNPSTLALKMPASIVAQIARLPEMPINDVKLLWQELFGSLPHSYSRPFLERRIAYRLQENEFRKINPELLESNKRRIEAMILEEDLKNKIKKTDQDYRLAPGTLLTREYHRIEHCVLVTADGQFDYQGRIYKSLSVIAREITGTRWSGPLFFGLKAPTKTKTKQSKNQIAKGGRK